VDQFTFYFGCISGLCEAEIHRIRGVTGKSADSAGRKSFWASPIEVRLAYPPDLSQGRTPVQPFGQAAKCFRLTAGQYLDTAIAAIDCVTPDPEPHRLLAGRLAEPYPLDTSLHMEYPAFIHGLF